MEFPGALYHVIVRGNERRDVFRDDADRELYLRRVHHYRERFEFRLLAYCLMSNHVHLALESGSVPLSRVMLGLQSSYTQAFNRRYRRSGHLFQGRYKAYLVDGDRYFAALIRYVHHNPVEARLLGSADFQQQLGKQLAAGVKTYFQRAGVPLNGANTSGAAQ